MHLGINYTELQKMPVRYRHWFIKRLSSHFEKKNDMINPKSSNRNVSSNNNIPLSAIEEMMKKKL